MIELYHHGSSVCAAKVRFALGEKGLGWQGHYLDILRGDQFAPRYLRLNPKAVVPTLVHDGCVVESTVINEYIDDVFPDSPLKPSAPEARAAMRMWTKAVDEDLHPACAEVTFSSASRSSRNPVTRGSCDPPPWKRCGGPADRRRASTPRTPR